MSSFCAFWWSANPDVAVVDETCWQLLCQTEETSETQPNFSHFFFGSWKPFWVAVSFYEDEVAWHGHSGWNMLAVTLSHSGKMSKTQPKFLQSETERGPECSCRINTQGSWSALKDANTTKTRVAYGHSNLAGCISGRVYTCTLYLHACQVRVTVGNSGLCCCTCATFFELINSLVYWFSKCLHFSFHAWMSATMFDYHSWPAICCVPWPVQMFCAEVWPGRWATLCCSSHWSWDAAAAHAGGAGSRALPVCSPLKHKHSQWNTNTASETQTQPVNHSNTNTTTKHKHSQWITQTQPVNHSNRNTASQSMKHKYSQWINETQIQPVNQWNTNTTTETQTQPLNHWN